MPRHVLDELHAVEAMRSQAEPSQPLPYGAGDTSTPSGGWGRVRMDFG